MINDDEGVRRVLLDIKHERARQDTKWGPHTWPSGLDGEENPWGGFASDAEMRALDQKDFVDAAMKDGTLTWRDIFEEEWFETLAEHTDAAARVELVQAAAVLVAWIEDIDRKEAVS